MVRQQQINALFKREVARKGYLSSLSFATFAICIFFYYFSLESHKLSIRGACVAIFIAAISRILISRRMNQTGDIQPSENKVYKLLKVCIWANILGWAYIFSVAISNLPMNGQHYMVVLVLMAGFMSSAVITLAYDPYLFYPFQVFMLAPFISMAFYHYYRTGIDHTLFIAVTYVMYFIYQIKHYIDYRAQLAQRFNYQLDLEASLAELKKKQEVLVGQTAELMQVSKLKALSDMAGGLAHEVNNSLMIILGSVSQVEKSITISGAITDQIKERFNKTKSAIKKIETVIHGLHCFAEQVDKAPMELIPLERVIESTRNYCEEMIKAHSIHFFIDDIPKVMVNCHPFQLGQVLFNVIKNADEALLRHEYTENKWIRVGFEVNNGAIQIRVSNGGTPISEDVALKIFQPFFTTKDVGEGIGLSLSSSRGIARRHRGDLYLERDTEVTTFTLKIPVASFN